MERFIGTLFPGLREPGPYYQVAFDSRLGDPEWVKKYGDKFYRIYLAMMALTRDEEKALVMASHISYSWGAGAWRRRVKQTPRGRHLLNKVVQALGDPASTASDIRDRLGFLRNQLSLVVNEFNTAMSQPTARARNRGMRVQNRLWRDLLLDPFPEEGVRIWWERFFQQPPDEDEIRMV